MFLQEHLYVLLCTKYQSRPVRDGHTRVIGQCVGRVERATIVPDYTSNEER